MFLLLVYCLSFSITLCAAGQRTLVLLDNFAIKETHSIFFQSLRDRGHTLYFKLSDDASLALFKYGELVYDNLIIFSPNVEEFGGTIDKSSVLEFIDEGGNMLAVTGDKAGVLLREIAAECGVEVDIPGNSLIDHFNYDVSEPFYHTKVIIDRDRFIKSELIVGHDKLPILYQGGGLLVNKSNSLVLPIINAYSTSYCANPQQPLDSQPYLIGKNAALVVALQTWNNQRVVFSGSLYMFSNDAFNSAIHRSDGKVHVTSGNQAVSEALSKWVFKEVGEVRVKSVTHRKEGETETSSYTVTDIAIFTMELEEKKNGEWVPFNTNDLQLEFVRIDPFIRTIVPRVADGKYEVTFKIPDIYGVFKFKVDYMRIGYTNIFSTTQVPVRPLKHTQYERFILSAYPYYISAFSMMFGLFIFSLVIPHIGIDDKKQA